MKTLDRGRRTTLYPRYSNVKTFDQVSLTKRELMLETIEKKNREKRWRLSRDMWWRRIPRACAYWISRRIGNIFEEDVASTMRNVFQYSIKRFESEIRTLIDLYGPSDRHSTSPPPYILPINPLRNFWLADDLQMAMKKREKWFQIA